MSLYFSGENTTGKYVKFIDSNIYKMITSERIDLPYTGDTRTDSEAFQEAASSLFNKVNQSLAIYHITVKKSFNLMAECVCRMIWDMAGEFIDHYKAVKYVQGVFEKNESKYKENNNEN
jgi:hypothetical protein